MIKLKIMSEYDIKDYKFNYESKYYDVKIGVCGVFDTISVKWEYYAISYTSINSSTCLTCDLYKNAYINQINAYNVNNIKSHYRQFNTQYEADSFIKEYKLKWETGSNDTTQVIRDDKLNQILG